MASRVRSSVMAIVTVEIAVAEEKGKVSAKFATVTLTAAQTLAATLAENA
jgi:hypothetical protein